MSTASHLTWTNNPPSDIERTEIQLAISRAEKKKADLKASLTQNSSSEGVRVQKSVNKLDDFINARKPILSTLRHLPHEMLSYIFTLCLDPIRNRPWHRSHWHSIPSFTLSQVCRRWRAVALETPILWSLLVDVQLKPKLGSKLGYSYIKFLETLLRRSKNLDLWIYIHVPFHELDTHRVIAPLVRHSGRWRVVTFETSPSIVAAFRGIQHRLPRLRSLSLDLSRGDEATSLKLFSDAPSLTEVTISDLNPQLELPWGQLKSFNEQTKTVPGTQVPHVFRNSTDSLEHLILTLRTFVLVYTVAGVGLTRLDVPVTFPNLKTMRLTSQTNDSADLILFLIMLRSPCLEELHITGCHPASVAQPFLLQQFFEGSFKHSSRPSLKRLSLRGLTTLNNIGEILCLVPHLEHFETNLGTARDVLLKISGNGQNVPLLPELRSLIIDWDLFKGTEDIIMICVTFTELTSSRCKRTIVTIPSEGDASDHTTRTLEDISIIFTSQQSASDISTTGVHTTTFSDDIIIGVIASTFYFPLLKGTRRLSWDQIVRWALTKS